MTTTTVRLLRNGLLVTLGAGLAACASAERATDRVEVDIRGTDPAQPVTTAGPTSAVVSSGGGVVDYGDYRVAVAQDGDTVASVAARIGMSAAELGAYNGVQPSTPLLAGDELVLPQGAGTAVASAEPAPAPASSVDVAPLPDTRVPFEPLPASEPLAVAAVEPMPGLSEPEPEVEPASAPEAAPSPAPAGERPAWSPQLAAAAIDRVEGTGEDDGLPPPPSSAEPVPPAPEEPRALASPDLGQYQTPGDLATPFELTRPVEGRVAIPYNVGSGGQRNEGVDFAAAAGSPVVAAEDGEVALVSESLGGLGTIVLIRHPDDLMTVYGRLDQVQVQKGDYLERGQRFGVVADAPPGTEPRMHFEVRRGADSIDPMEML